MSVISSITGGAIGIPAPGHAAALTTPTGSGGFGDALTSAISHVDGLQQDAAQSVEQFLHGNGELHTVALATQRAEMAFDLAVQIRNKVVSAYQEIMKMQL